MIALDLGEQPFRLGQPRSRIVYSIRDLGIQCSQALQIGTCDTIAVRVNADDPHAHPPFIWTADPNVHGRAAATQNLFTVVFEAREHRHQFQLWRIPDRGYQRFARHQRGLQAASQRLQPAHGIDRVAYDGERKALLAADVADDRWPVIEPDADRILGAARGYEPGATLARSGQAGCGARSARSDLQLVHRRLQRG